jgi:hypothetical protein
MGTAADMAADMATAADMAALASLNPSQRNAVQRSLAQRLLPIQGPPGTGKTQVADVIFRVWKSIGVRGPAVGAAPSNVAADNLALSAEAAPVTGLAAPPATGPSAPSPATTVAERTDAVIGTLEMACDVRTDDFPWTSKLILVDEAAQATEPMTIQYRMHPSICSWPSQEFYGGVHSTASGHRPHADTHVVLIGDHMQRAPTVLSKAAVLGGTAASSWGGPKDGDDEDSTFLEDEERDILRGERSSTASGHRPHRHRLATPPPEAPGPAAPAATGRAAPRAREKAGDVVESTGGIFWAMPVTIKDGDDEDSTFLEDEERDISFGELDLPRL